MGSSEVEVSVSGGGSFALGYFLQLNQVSEFPASTRSPSAAPALTESNCKMSSTVRYLYSMARTLLGCTDLAVETVYPYPVLGITPSPPASSSLAETAEATVMAPSKLSCHP